MWGILLHSMLVQHGWQSGLNSTLRFWKGKIGARLQPAGSQVAVTLSMVTGGLLQHAGSGTALLVVGPQDLRMRAARLQSR